MKRRASPCWRNLWLVPAIAGSLAGCVTYAGPIEPPPPYAILPVDESMGCNGIAASFRYAARRAARLEYWLAVGPLSGYGYERYPLDAPKQLIDERRRLDALSDLQRTKGCTVMEPGPAVVEERLKLESSVRPPLPPEGAVPALPPPVVLNSKG